MKRIAYGEFMDDLDAVNRITAFFGLDSETEGDPFEEKVGKERLGGRSFW